MSFTIDSSNPSNTSSHDVIDNITSNGENTSADNDLPKQDSSVDTAQNSDDKMEADSEKLQIINFNLEGFKETGGKYNYLFFVHSKLLLIKLFFIALHYIY